MTDNNQTMQKITKESVRDLALYVHDFPKGDWVWQGKRHIHYIRDGRDLLEGKKAQDYCSGPNGVFWWQDQEGSWHSVEQPNDR